MSNMFIKMSELAKNEEVATMVDNSVSEVKTWVETSYSPDWNAKEDEEGYIKNKPFGEPIEQLICRYDKVNITSIAGNGYGSLYVSFINNFLYDTSITYTVIINDKKYSNISSNSIGHLSNDYTGSYNPLYENSDFILFSNGGTSGQMYFKEPIENGTLSIYANVISKLDNKYSNGISQINFNGTTYSPGYVNNENVVNINGVARIKINNTYKGSNFSGDVDLGDVVTSVTINGERHTKDVDLDADVQKMIDATIENELCEEINVINGYEFVDMGLSVKWATCNIGATKPEDGGWYFMWGDTKAYNSDRTPVGGGDSINFGENSDCPYWVSGEGFSSKWSKYTNTNGFSSTGIKDSKLILDPEDDAAYVHIDSNCRMPTKTEFDELIDACNTNWTNNYNNTGVNGYLFTLKSDSSKTLFFPVTGILSNNTIHDINTGSHYLSSSLYDKYANCCNASNMSETVLSLSPRITDRFLGSKIRAVLPSDVKIKIPKYLSKSEVQESYQPKGEYVTSDKLEEYAKVESLDQYATTVQLEGYQPKGEYILKSESKDLTVAAANKLICTASESTDISNVPTTSTICTVSVSADGTFGLDGTLSPGTELQVFIENESDNDVTITIPDTFKFNGTNEITIAPDSYGEINVIAVGTKLYLRAL